LHLPPQPNILDIGCGPGLVTRTLIDLFPKSIIYGLDHSREMLALYHKEFPEAITMKEDFQRSISLPHSSIDLVVSAGAVSEYGNDETPNYIHQVLKNNGAFVNIGIIKNPFTFITSLLWKYRLTNQRKFSRSCLEAGFSQVSTIQLPWETFPANWMRFAVMAIK